MERLKMYTSWDELNVESLRAPRIQRQNIGTMVLPLQRDGYQAYKNGLSHHMHRWDSLAEGIISSHAPTDSSSFMWMM